jgi:hypothetical protein
MRVRVRQCLGAAAILAIALHGLLLGLAPLAASAAADPFTVICHSAPQTPGEDQAPANRDIRAHGCDHCNLCSAAPAPGALDEVLAGDFAPARLLHVLRPVSADTRHGLATSPNRARGPPTFA